MLKSTVKSYIKLLPMIIENQGEMLDFIKDNKRWIKLTNGLLCAHTYLSSTLGTFHFSFFIPWNNCFNSSYAL